MEIDVYTSPDHGAKTRPSASASHKSAHMTL